MSSTFADLSDSSSFDADASVYPSGSPVRTAYEADLDTHIAFFRREIQLQQQEIHAEQCAAHINDAVIDPWHDPFCRSSDVVMNAVFAQPLALGSSPQDDKKTSETQQKTPSSKVTSSKISKSTKKSAPQKSPHDDRLELMETQMLQLHALGDFSSSLMYAEQILAESPQHSVAQHHLHLNQQILQQMYQSKLGDLHNTPHLIVPYNSIIWMNLHHHAGYLLSQVDGLISYEELLDISPLSRLETLKILSELKEENIIV